MAGGRKYAKHSFAMKKTMFSKGEKPILQFFTSYFPSFLCGWCEETYLCGCLKWLFRNYTIFVN